MTTPRVLRPVPDPLGAYVRPASRDHLFLEQMLVEGKSVGTGLVADPCLAERQKDLLEIANQKGLDTVLDPRSFDLSTVGGFARSGVPTLPWAADEPHRLSSMNDLVMRDMVERIADFAAAGDHRAVLAPTHLLEDVQSGWLSRDRTLTLMLRGALDSRGLQAVKIYYPLIIRSSGLRSSEARAQLVHELGRLPIDALWLRLHPFGTSTSGPLALKRYMEVCRDLHATGVPLVAEHSGTVGVALLAFGCVGGIESGVTISERVNFDGYLKVPDPNDKPFARPARVYLHDLGAFLDPKEAAAFFEQRGMKSAHGCRDTGCCPRGWRDMTENARPHFVQQRAREVGGLSSMPETLRAGRYMETFLRPATDRAVRAAELEPKLSSARKRLEQWRGTLGADLTSRSSFSTSLPASGKRLRRSA